jgi:hypothetical protein
MGMRKKSFRWDGRLVRIPCVLNFLSLIENLSYNAITKVKRLLTLNSFHLFGHHQVCVRYSSIMYQVFRQTGFLLFFMMFNKTISAIHNKFMQSSGDILDSN